MESTHLTQLSTVQFVTVVALIPPIGAVLFTGTPPGGVTPGVPVPAGAEVLVGS
jgi:hypothetical protein